MSRLRGRIWPDGTWGVGFERKFDPPLFRETHGTQNETDFWADAIGVHGVETALAFKRELGRDGSQPVTELLQNNAELEQGSRPPLTSSESSNSHKNPKRGSTGITAFGRKMIRSGGTLLEQLYGKRNLTLATLTIGYQEVGQWQGITESWSEIVRRLTQELRRLLSPLGFGDDFLYCTELQESRLALYGVPGYHLHLLWPNLRPGRWSISVSQLREIWTRILSSYVPCSTSSPPPNHRIELAVVKKTVAGYLAKYLSKGLSASGLQRLESMGMTPPTSWWGMSLGLRKRIKKQIVMLDSNTANFLMDGIRMGAFRGKINEHKVEYMGERVTVGFYGYLGEWNKEHPVHSIANENRNERMNHLNNGGTEA